ncbi:cytochrome P450 family protein [Abortiporus biennis]
MTFLLSLSGFELHTPLLYYFLATLTVFIVDKVLKSRKSTLPLPPGPKGLPIVGNLFDALVLDAEAPRAFWQWSRKYGSDIMFTSTPFQSTLVLNSAMAAFDLLEKKSQIYSDRPHSTLDELTGLDFNFGFMQYSLRWRIQTATTRAFLRRVLQSPSSDDMVETVSLTFGSSIIKVVYGADIKDTTHKYVQSAHKHITIIDESHYLGSFWIDYFPFFKNIPAWIPGVRFNKFANESKPILEEAKRTPFEDTKHAAIEGSAEPSIAYSLLGKLQSLSNEISPDEYLEQEETVINTLGIAYATGNDTTSSSASTFLIAMTMNPRIQEKAQMELDAYLGVSRLPEYSDYTSLPYIRAIALEVMRYNPVTPLGIPHRLMEDDEYNGFLIPKGTIVIANFWATLHNPEDYPDPDIFKPERFLKGGGQLDPSVRDPTTLAFGYGRRICPGRHFNNQAMFLFIASTLQVYNISPAKDENGNFVDLTSCVEYTPGIVATPRSLPCVLTPRSEAARRLIIESE